MTLDQALFGISIFIFFYTVARGRRPLLLASRYHRWPSPTSEVPLKSSSRSMFTIFMRLDIYSLYRDEAHDDLVAGVGLDIAEEKYHM